MNAHWGCRCCRGNGRGGVAHKRWQLHRAVNAHKWWHRAVNASSNGRQLQIRFRSGNSGKRRYTGSIPEAEIYRKHTGSGDIPEADAYSSMPRCHICVTGQLQRLELSKKWDMMIHPISAFMKVTVILCLNRQTSHFARANARDALAFHGNSSYLDMPLRSFQGVTKRNGVTLRTRWVSYDELENISIVTSRIHDQKSSKKSKLSLKRATSHLRQYYTQTWCDIGVLPDYFIKIRDDAIPLFRINWYTVLRYTRRSSKMVVTQHCASWHGLNDKIAIVGGSNHSISKYIYAPFSRYHQATPGWVMNPETYLLYVMMQEGFVQYSTNLGVAQMKNGVAYIRAVRTKSVSGYRGRGRGAGRSDTCRPTRTYGFLVWLSRRASWRRMRRTTRRRLLLRSSRAFSVRANCPARRGPGLTQRIRSPHPFVGIRRPGVPDCPCVPRFETTHRTRTGACPQSANTCSRVVLCCSAACRPRRPARGTDIRGD